MGGAKYLRVRARKPLLLAAQKYNPKLPSDHINSFRKEGGEKTKMGNKTLGKEAFAGEKKAN